MQYMKDGKTFEFELDIDRIIEEEEKDPDYSLMADLKQFEDGKIRFSAFKRLAGFIGTDMDSMRKQGLNLADLISIFTGCIEELGFTSEE